MFNFTITVWCTLPENMTTERFASAVTAKKWILSKFPCEIWRSSKTIKAGGEVVEQELFYY